MTDERIEAAKESIAKHHKLVGLTGGTFCEEDFYRMAINALEAADKVRPKAVKPDDWNKCLDRVVEMYEDLTSDKRTRMQLALASIGIRPTIEVNAEKERVVHYYNKGEAADKVQPDTIPVKREVLEEENYA